MELAEKLQELRRQRGLTQEELAAALFVSRTAISKWESGRGFPSIDSLKALSAFFSVSIDHLLSTDEVLTIAGEDSRRQEARWRSTVCGLLDCGAALLLLLLPLFGQTVEGVVHAVSLPALTGVSPWVRAGCFAYVILSVLLGVGTLALQHLGHPLWEGRWARLSLLPGAAGVLLFILCRQPYAAALVLAFLFIRAWMLLKAR
ncbi:MAG: helix-turn-helix transcriptional regulator [Clostridia bacterium]|nr:helix-turn-helix transcriptional regulator [Clostridia bacterium]